MLSVTRITLTALFVQAYAGPAKFMPAQNAPAVQPALSRRGALAAASSILLPLPAFAREQISQQYNPALGFREQISQQYNPPLGFPLEPTYVYQGTPKSYGPKKASSKGGSKKIEYDKNGDRTPGSDSVTEAEEPVPTSGRFGLEPKKAPPKPQFYGPKKAGKGATRRDVKIAEEMLSETESDFAYLPAAAFIGFLVGSGVTFIVFRRRPVLSTTAAQPFLSA